MLKKEPVFQPFLGMGLNCLNAIEPLKGDSLPFNTKGPGVAGSQVCVCFYLTFSQSINI